MNEGWEYKKLGEVAEVIHGKNQKDVLSANGTYPIYGSGGNVMGYASDYLCEAGTTILGRKGSINNPLYIKERFWNVDTAFGISAKEGNDGKYLYYFIKTVDWLKKNTGTTLPSLTQQVVKSVVLPVPPLSEQQSIVDYLDSAFAKIDAMKANAEKALNEAKALFQASLKEMLEPKEGWEYKQLGKICDFRSGFAFKSNKFTEKGEPIIRISDIQNEVVDDSNLVYFNLDSYTEDLSKYLIYPNDILIAMSGGTTGKLGINTSNRTYYLNQRVGVFRENKKYLNHRFLFYFLHTKSEESLRIAAGAAQPNLSTAQIKSFVVPLPLLSEQQTIVVTLDSLKSKVDKLQSNYDKISQECDALKQAILRQIFE